MSKAPPPEAPPPGHSQSTAAPPAPLENQSSLATQDSDPTVRRRIGIFGGSFDPVHHGHLILAETCREQLELDEVRIIPAATSPLKPHGPVASGTARAEMLRIAFDGTSGFRIDPIELERPGLSYTVDTLRELHAREPNVSWTLLVGADSVASMDRWERPAELLRLAQLGIVHRAGHPTPDIEATRELLAPEDRANFHPRSVSMPAIEISSTDLRARIAAGRSIRFRTPRAIENYIRDTGLYRAMTST